MGIQTEILVFIGLVIFFIGTGIIVRMLVNKAARAAENKYADYKNKKSPPTETKLSERHKK